MKGLLFVLFLVIVSVGCTGLPGTPGQQNGPPGNGIIPGPVDTVPSNSTIVVQVNQKDPIYNTVDVVFAGGRGQIQVSTIDVRFTSSTGRTETRQLKPEKGATVTFQGTNGTDRVEVWVNFYSGKQYKITDTLVPYRTRS